MDGPSVDEAEELNETDAGGNDSGGPAAAAAAVLGASRRQDGWDGDGRSLVREAGVRTGEVVVEEDVSGLFVVSAGQALSDDSGRSALDRLVAPRRLDAAHRL